MKDILSTAHRSVLDEVAWSNVLLALDFDGTLAPLAADPKQGRMRRTTRDLLATLAKLYPVIVVSGRPQSDAMKRPGGIGLSGIVGDHGEESWLRGAGQEREVEAWWSGLEAAVAPLNGVVIEHTGLSVAVHYRQSREKKRARAAILAAAAKLEGVRIIGGKQVVNILLEGAPHKGLAVERERTRLNCDTVLYVGDDDSDEEVFALDQPGRLLAIRVVARRISATLYYIASQSSIDLLLRTLVESRYRRANQRRAVR